MVSFSPHVLCLCMLVSFCWVQILWILPLLSDGYFCFHINILGFLSLGCSQNYLQYLKTDWIFCTLLLRFVMWDQFPTKILLILSTFPKCPVNFEVYQSSWWEQSVFKILCYQWTQTYFLGSSSRCYYLELLSRSIMGLILYLSFINSLYLAVPGLSCDMSNL